MLTFQSVFYCFACFAFMGIALIYMKILRIFQVDSNLLKKPLFISLDKDDFACLVRGGILKIGYFKSGSHHLVSIALQDIGWPVMLEEIDKSVLGIDTLKGRVKLIT